MSADDSLKAFNFSQKIVNTSFKLFPNLHEKLTPYFCEK